VHFFDVTGSQDSSSGSDFAAVERRASVVYPSRIAHADTVKRNLLPQLSKEKMSNTLQTFSDFNNRYYKSSYGKQSSQWLQAQVQGIIDAAGTRNVTVKSFAHSWGQNSIIATIPGKSEKTVVVGAHQDSINLQSPMNGRAPGAGECLTYLEICIKTAVT